MAEKSSSGSQGFWKSLPGILTGIAALVVAVSGLIALFGGDSTTTTTTEPRPPSSTSPEASTTTQAESTTAQVPSVVGVDFAQAEDELKDAGFRILKLTRITELAPNELVLDQIPVAGVTAELGSSVRLTVAQPPTKLSIPPNISVEADTSAEFLARPRVDLDSGREVTNATGDLVLAFGVEAEQARFASGTGTPTYDDCLSLLLEDTEEITWATTRWLCVLTDGQRISAVRILDIEPTEQTLVVVYNLQFITWDVPPGTF